MTTRTMPLSPKLNATETALLELITRQFKLDPQSDHGPRHWLTVRRNGLYLATRHGGDLDVVRLFALFHDACREREFGDPLHGPRGARLAQDFRRAGHFQLADDRMQLLVTACQIHNGAGPQTEPTLASCLDADRLDLGRVGIIPDPGLLSTPTAKDIARRAAWHELATPPTPPG